MQRVYTAFCYRRAWTGDWGGGLGQRRMAIDGRTGTSIHYSKVKIQYASYYSHFFFSQLLHVSVWKWTQLIYLRTLGLAAGLAAEYALLSQAPSEANPHPWMPWAYCTFLPPTSLAGPDRLECMAQCWNQLPILFLGVKWISDAWTYLSSLGKNTQVGSKCWSEAQGTLPVAPYLIPRSVLWRKFFCLIETFNYVLMFVILVWPLQSPSKVLILP